MSQYSDIAIEALELDGVHYAARTCGDQVLDIVAERASDQLVEGTVVTGRVVQTSENGKAALVDIGRRSAAPLVSPNGPRDGAVVPVQLLSSCRAMRDGKQPPVTLDITFPGRHLLFRPFGHGVAVSRRLSQTDQPEWLDQLTSIRPGGWTVRTIAKGQPSSIVLAEAERLSKLGDNVCTSLVGRKAGEILQSGPRVAQRLILDEPDPIEIRVGPSLLQNQFFTWARSVCPDLLERIDPAAPSVLHRRIDDIDDLIGPSLPLPGGGSLWIEQTRALTAIDVDSPIGSQPLAVNRQAAQALAEHIRLRNLGGLFAVDFLRMGKSKGRRQVLETLKNGLNNKATPSASNLHFAPDFSPVGPYVFSRQRRGCTLADAIDGAEE